METRISLYNVNFTLIKIVAYAEYYQNFQGTLKVEPVGYLYSRRVNSMSRVNSSLAKFD